MQKAARGYSLLLLCRRLLCGGIRRTAIDVIIEIVIATAVVVGVVVVVVQQEQKVVGGEVHSLLLLKLKRGFQTPRPASRQINQDGVLALLIRCHPILIESRLVGEILAAMECISVVGPGPPVGFRRQLFGFQCLGLLQRLSPMLQGVLLSFVIPIFLFSFLFCPSISFF